VGDVGSVAFSGEMPTRITDSTATPWRRGAIQENGRVVAMMGEAGRYRGAHRGATIHVRRTLGYAGGALLMLNVVGAPSARPRPARPCEVSHRLRLDGCARRVVCRPRPRGARALWPGALNTIWTRDTQADFVYCD
jgi:hypothetical protein